MTREQAIKALAAYARKEQLNQPTVKELFHAGYIEASDVTNNDTPIGVGKEYSPGLITERGRRLLESAGAL